MFLGDKNIPFTTIRSAWSKMGNKLEYYRGLRGQEFEIVIKEVKYESNSE